MKIVHLKLDNFSSTVATSSKKNIINQILSYKKFANIKSALIVTDENVAPLFDSWNIEKIVLPAGEKYKNINSVTKIIDAAIEKKLTRNSLLIGVGGGVICDMCAFAASVILRGIKLALVPTTLLSMVDASVGGKTGIDYMGYKNQVGTFYPADLVLIASDFLSTLSENEFKSGLAEVIKSGLLRDKKIISLLQTQSEKIKNRNSEILEELVRRSILVKSYFVKKDFKEKNIRAYLNLGHTFGHALESCFTLSDGEAAITHGQGVAWGVFMASRLAVALAGKNEPLKKSLLKEQAILKSLLCDYGFSLSYPNLDREKFFLAMLHDKKNTSSEIRFVLQKKFYKTYIQSVSLEKLKSFDFL